MLRPDARSHALSILKSTRRRKPAATAPPKREALLSKSDRDLFLTSTFDLDNFALR